MIWRVGDGSQIRVFHDNWIPGSFPTKAVSRTLGGEGDSTVSSLIDQTTKEWNGHLIDLKFAPFMDQKIKAIPLSTTMMGDCLVWP